MQTSAILLAGGRSSRMGTCKALLNLNGVTLLQRAFEKLRSALDSGEKIFVSGDWPQFDGCTDEIPGRGPIEGIWACTRRMQFGTVVLVIPVDMPFLDVGLLKELIHQLSIDESVAHIQFENFEMPFAFRFDQDTEDILKGIRDCKAGNGRSLWKFRAETHGKLLRSEKSEYFKNVNTQQEWEACQ